MNSFILSECETLVNHTLKSPGYPKSYPRNMDCSYSVHIAHGMAMKMDFQEFDLEYVPFC